jgi:hypothetical protein
MKEVECTLNHRPLVKCNADPNDFSVLTPMDIISAARVPSPLPMDQFVKSDGLRRTWRASQYHVEEFWKRFSHMYLPLLQKRQKWLRPVRNLQVGDLTLMVDENSPRNCWPKAIVTDVFPDKYGNVRRVKLRTATGTSFERDVRKLCLLEGAD